jgi:hypothetical protein
MPSERASFVNRLPVIGQIRRQRIENTAQNEIFAAEAPHDYIDPEPTVREWLKEAAPTARGVLEYLRSTFPFTQWILGYNLTWLIGDLIAGKWLNVYILDMAKNSFRCYSRGGPSSQGNTVTLKCRFCANFVEVHGICETGTGAS